MGGLLEVAACNGKNLMPSGIHVIVKSLKSCLAGLSTREASAEVGHAVAPVPPCPCGDSDRQIRDTVLATFEVVSCSAAAVPHTAGRIFDRS